VVRDRLGAAHRYAFGASRELAHAIAGAAGVGADHVVVGCGSSQVLDALVSVTVGPERPFVTAAPTFGRPAARARAVGAPVIEVPVDAALRLDLDAMAGRASGAGLVYVCNPNNPTGTLHDGAAIARFVEA